VPVEVEDMRRMIGDERFNIEFESGYIV